MRSGWYLLALTFVLLLLFEPGYAAEVVNTLRELLDAIVALA